MAEYDKIGDAYTKEEERPIRKYVINPSFFEILGNVKGKDILDLGCGEGKLTRKIKEKGAEKVIGIDLSKEMIKLAIKKENKNPLGINYIVSDVIKLKKIKEFNIAIGGFLLHYSKTKKELFNMCKNIYKNLKKNSRFIALNNNPENSLSFNEKYDNLIKGKLPLKEGDKLTVTLSLKGKKYVHL